MSHCVMSGRPGSYPQKAVDCGSYPRINGDRKDGYPRINGDQFTHKRRPPNKEPVSTCNKYPSSRAAPIGDNLAGCHPNGLHLLPTSIFKERKPMKSKFTIPLISFALVTLLHTQQSFAVVLRGMPSCGLWTSQQDARDRIWLDGYLSGLAFAYNKDILNGTDKASIYGWVDNYCRANPLSELAEAGNALAQELIRRKKL